jgi:hypothetical protein
MSVHPRALVVAVLYGVAATLALAAALRLQGSTAKADNLIATPYTVTLQEVVVHKDGRERTGSRYTRAVRADGSIAQKLGVEGSGSRVINLAVGQEIRTHDQRLKKSTVHIAAYAAEWHRSPSSNCIDHLGGERATARGESVQAVEDLGGYRAVRVSNAGQTWWFALDHGCAEIGSQMMFDDGGRSLMRLVSLVDGPPDDRLFAVGPEYQEGPPSSLMPEPGKNCSVQCIEQRQARSKILDEHYNKHRVK